ncbi:Ig-like domain repeat protein, partial [Candidatus Bipolaricaulota bacterium]
MRQDSEQNRQYTMSHAVFPPNLCRRRGIVVVVIALLACTSIGFLGFAASTTTSLSSSLNPSVFGQTVTFTVSVGDVQTPSGTITLKDGATTLEVKDLAIEGDTTVTFDVSTLSVGSHTIIADYSGFVTHDFDASSDSLFQTVNKADTTLLITGDSPDTSVVGQPYVVSGTVTVDAPGDGTPTGTVTVYDGEGNDCAVNLNGSGDWSCTLTSTTEGSKMLTADYEGDENFNGSSDTEPHTVSKADTTLVITAHSPERSVFGEAFEVFWNVTVDSPGAGTPTGTVNVSDGVNSCSAPVGNGSCALPSTSVGTKTLTAGYSGDANFNSSPSSTASHIVEKAETTITISSDSPDPSVVGGTYTVSGIVTAQAPGSGTPTGNVTVDDGENSCTVGLSSGAWDCSTMTSTTAGPKTLTISYAGDPNFRAATTSEGHDVDKADPTITITSDNPDPSLAGQEYTVSGTVTGPVTATGTVIVTDGAGASCAANLASGAWSCRLSSLGPQGSKTLTAVYEGDENLNGASDTESHAVNERLVSLVIVGPSQACVGDSVTFTAQLSDGSNPAVPESPPFAGTVSWTLPSGATTCTVAGSDGCSVTYTPAAGDVGDKTISAQYTGDPNYADSATVNHSLSVTPRSVLIDITCQPATVYINQQTNITATVRDVGCGGSVTPEGTLSLGLVPQGTQAGTFVQPTGSSTDSGSIEFTGGKYTPTANSNADDESHLIQATFTGTGDFEGITATASTPLDVNKREVQVTVEIVDLDGETPPVRGPNAESLSTAPAVCFIGDTVGVRVTIEDVTPDNSSPTANFASDIVNLDDLGKAGAFSQGTHTLDENDCINCPTPNDFECMFAVSYTPAAGDAGTAVLRAAYQGSPQFAAVSSETTLTIETRPTATFVTCAPAEVVVDERCMVMITVDDVGPVDSFSLPSGVLYLSTSGNGSFYETVASTSAITSKTLTVGTTVVYYEAETAAAAREDHVLKADYVGTGLPADAAAQIHEDSSGTASLTVSLRKTTTTLTGDYLCDPPDECPMPYRTTQMSSGLTIEIVDVSPGDKSSPGGDLMIEAPGGDAAGGYFTAISSDPAHDSVTGTGTSLVTLTWNDFDSALDTIEVTATYVLVEKTVPVHPIVAAFKPTDEKHLASVDGSQVQVEVDEDSYPADNPAPLPSDYGSDGVIYCGLIDATTVDEIFNFTNTLQAYLDILWAADLGATILQVIPDVLVDVTDPAWSIIHAIFQGATVDLDGDGIPGLLELGYSWAGLYDFNPDEDGDGIWTKDE